MMKVMSFQQQHHQLLLLLLLGIVLSIVQSYPHYLLNEKGCHEKKLEVGFKMMGYLAYQEDAKKRSPIKVCR